MRSPILASAVLMLAQAMPSWGQTTDGVFTIQTIEVSTDRPVPSNTPGSVGGTSSKPGPATITDSFSVSIPPELSSLLQTDTGVMSIPAGETPLSTSTGHSTSTSHTSGTPSPSTTPKPSGSASTPPSHSPTSAAAPGQTAGRGGSFLVATVSGLSLAFGFAWMLL